MEEVLYPPVRQPGGNLEAREDWKENLD